jgi:hypothetical protein
MSIFKSLEKELKNLGLNEDLFGDFKINSNRNYFDIDFGFSFGNSHNSSNSRSRKGIFFPAKHKELADIITIKSVHGARRAVRKIKSLLRKRKYSLKQLRASLILAGVRAKVIAKTRARDPAVKRRLLQVAKIYLSEAKKLGKK